MSALAAKDDAPLVALDLEQQVLAGILSNNAAFERVQAFLEPAHFGDARHQEIFAAMKALLDAGKPATVPSLSAYMQQSEALNRIGGARYLAQIITGLASPSFTEDYARMLLDFYVRRQAMAVFGEAAERLGSADMSDQAAAVLAATATTLDELASAGTAPVAVSIGEAAGSAVAAVTDIVKHGVVPQLVPSGFDDVDRVIDGFDPGSYTIIGARPSVGKAQPLDAKILMADGSWKAMGEIALGDRLASIDGAASRVSGVYPQGEREVFRVTFSDGRSTEACGEHLWRVGNRKWGSDQVLSTRDLIELLRKPSYCDRVYVPTVSGHFGHDEALPVDPWLLGALVANGTLSVATPIFSTGDAVTLWHLQEKVAAAGGMITRSPGNHYDFRIKGIRQRNEITLALQSMQLIGKRSHEKFLPSKYLSANREARVELLRGLMDTDGYVEKNGATRYSTSSEQLARDVRDLVRSLGGNCEIVTKTPHYTYLGERREGRPHFICNIRFNRPREFVGLLRKQRRAPEFNEVRLNIASIESVGVKPVQCIAVTHPSRLYVTDDYVVTHNTSLAQWMAYEMARGGYGVAFFSIEMSLPRLVERWLAGIAEIPAPAIKTGRLYDGPIRRPLNAAEMQRIEDASDQIASLPISLDASARPSVAEIVAGVRKMRREKKPVDIVFVDYLGLLRPPQSARSRYEQVTEISGELKAAAKTLGLPFVVLAQLSRANEARDDKRPQLQDLRDCLPGSALVKRATDGARVTIKEIVEQKHRFDVVAVNEDMKLRSRPIIDAWPVGPKKILKITTRTGRVLRCSEGHKLLADGFWAEARSLEPGESVACPRSYGHKAGSNVSQDAATILGWLIGDGHLNGSAALTVASEAEARLAARMARDAFGVSPTIKPEHKRTTALRVVMTMGRMCGAKKNPMTRWLRQIGAWGLTGGDKRIPAAAFSWRDDSVAALLRGLFHADGSIAKKAAGRGSVVKLSTISEGLARDVQHLLMRFGIHATVASEAHSGAGFKSSSSRIWRVAIYDMDQVAMFVEAIGFLDAKQTKASNLVVVDKQNDAGRRDRMPMWLTPYAKHVKEALRMSIADLGWRPQGKRMSRSTAIMLAERLRDDRIRLFANSDVYWDEIVSIVEDGEEECYDLTVADLSNFCVDDFITHNSGALEQDADIIMFLHREHYYLTRSPPKQMATESDGDFAARVHVHEAELARHAGRAELNVAKNRNGRLGLVDLAFDDSLTRFSSLARGEQR